MENVVDVRTVLENARPDLNYAGVTAKHGWTTLNYNAAKDNICGEPCSIHGTRLF